MYIYIVYIYIHYIDIIKYIYIHVADQTQGWKRHIRRLIAQKLWCRSAPGPGPEKKKRGSWSGPLELIRIYMVIRVRKTGCYVDFTVM